MRTSLRQILLEEDSLTPELVHSLYGAQRNKGGSIDTAILELTELSEENISTFLGKYHELEIAQPEDWNNIDITLGSRCPRHIAETYRIAPIRLENQSMVVLCNGKLHESILNRLQTKLSLKIIPLFATELRCLMVYQALYARPLETRYEELRTKQAAKLSATAVATTAVATTAVATTAVATAGAEADSVETATVEAISVEAATVEATSVEAFPVDTAPGAASSPPPSSAPESLDSTEAGNHNQITENIAPLETSPMAPGSQQNANVEPPITATSTSQERSPEDILQDVVKQQDLIPPSVEKPAEEIEIDFEHQTVSLTPPPKPIQNESPQEELEILTSSREREADNLPISEVLDAAQQEDAPSRAEAEQEFETIESVGAIEEPETIEPIETQEAEIYPQALTEIVEAPPHTGPAQENHQTEKNTLIIAPIQETDDTAANDTAANDTAANDTEKEDLTPLPSAPEALAEKMNNLVMESQEDLEFIEAPPIINQNDTSDSTLDSLRSLLDANPKDWDAAIENLNGADWFNAAWLAQNFPGPFLYDPYKHRQSPPPFATLSGITAFLSHQPPARVTPIVSPQLKSPLAKNRFTALYYFMQFGTETNLGEIAGRLYDVCDANRVMAAEILRRHKSSQRYEKITQRLCKKLRIPIVQTQVGVIQILGQLREKRAVDFLIPLLGSKHREIVGTTASALAVITGQELGIDLDTWQQWWRQNNHKHRSELLVNGLAHQNPVVRKVCDRELQLSTGIQVGQVEEEQPVMLQEKWTSWLRDNQAHFDL